MSLRRMINGVIEGANVSKRRVISPGALCPASHFLQVVWHFFSSLRGAQSQMALPSSHMLSSTIYFLLQFKSLLATVFCFVLFCFVFACHSFNEIRLVLGDLLPFLIILLPLVIERSTCLRLQGVKMRGRVQKEDWGRVQKVD